MTKARGINLDGYTLTAVVTTPAVTFVEYSKRGEEGAMQTVVFVDRGSNGLDKGDKLITSQKNENRKNENRHWDVGDEIIGKFGKKLKELVDGARADRGRVITKIPQSFNSGSCSIYMDDCGVKGTFKPPLTPETKFQESTYSENDLCGNGMTSFDPARCEQVQSSFDYAKTDGRSLKAEAMRLSDIDEKFGYINTYGLEPQLGQYYQPDNLQAAALDVFYPDPSGASYLHLDLNKAETPASAPQTQQAQL